MTITGNAHPWLRNAWRAVWLVSFGIGCSDVGEVELNICGNRVVETGEDCDGQEGCNRACRYECTVDDQTYCPPAWGCDGEARICKSARGFFKAHELLKQKDYTPRVSDMDGDGRDDVLLFHRGLPSLAYFFGLDGSAQRSVPLPAARSALTTDLTSDDLADVLLAGDSLVAFKSLGNRAFTALGRSSRAVQPSSRLLAADLDCDRRRDLLLLEGNKLYRAISSQELELIAELEVSAKDITFVDSFTMKDSTVAASGALPQGAATSCEMLALGVANRDVVFVYGGGPVGPGESVQLELLSTLRAPGGTFNSLRFVDANADGKQDLLLQSSDVFGALKYLGYGVGDGTFHSNATLPATQGDGLAAPAFPEEPGMILCEAPGDVVGYFTSTSSYGGPQAVSYQDARALDVTADGLVDVAAVAYGRLNVLRGHPTGEPSMVSLVSNGEVTLRDVGDFDGDGRADLLISDSKNLIQTQPRTLSVLFAPFETGTSLSELADVENTSQALVGYLRDQSGYADPYSDVAVIYGKADDMRLSFLEGSSDRSLRFPLTKPSSGVDTFPTYGIFREAAEVGLLRTTQSEDYVGISSGGNQDAPPTLELLSIEQSETEQPESIELGLESTLVVDAVAAFDDDEDGVHELYVLGRADFDAQAPLFRISLQQSPPKLSKVELPRALDLRGLVVKDIDGDGRPELITKDAEAVYVLSAPSGAAKWHRLATPPVRLGSCYPTFAHAFVQVDRDAPLELVLGCVYLPDGFDGSEELDPDDLAGGLLVYNVDWDEDTLSAVDEVQGQAGPIADSIEVGDFNGDGVDDLITGEGDVSLYLGEPNP